MVLFSDRRHRIHADEVPAVKELVEAKLVDLLGERLDLSTAQMFFRLLYRFENYARGRPTYPDPITWDVVAALLEAGMRERFEEIPAKVPASTPAQDPEARHVDEIRSEDVGGPEP